MITENVYVIVGAGWAIGQAIYATVKAWDIQNKNEAIAFWPAIKIVYKQFASFVFAVLMLILVVFAMPDIIKNILTNDSLTGNMKTIQNWFRLSTVGFGFVCQYAGILFFSKLNKAVKKAIGSDTDPEPPTTP